MTVLITLLGFLVIALGLACLYLGYLAWKAPKPDASALWPWWGWLVLGALNVINGINMLASTF